MELSEILESLKAGKINVPKAQKLLSLYSIEKIQDFAKIDVDRKKRKGIPEVIFAKNKQLNEIKLIINKTIQKTDPIVISRINKKDLPKIIAHVKKRKLKIKRGKNSSTILVHKKPIKSNQGIVGILAAGTSDIGIAEEARLMCESMNCKCICSYDVGVAGMHRLFPILKKLLESDVSAIIVVAGMEGALPTVVSSLVDVPVIGVPASVGYGYGEKGIAALASMLQSCSLGLAVVNIDNGIGAGAIASNIANKISRN